MTWILTRTGKHFDYADPAVRTLSLIDIAAGLSCECRFAGMGGFYSVSQHSVHCSQIVPEEFAFEALMHDAAEAYCGDVTSPFKMLLPDYRKHERLADIAIRTKFRLPPECSPEVKHADLVMLASERRDLLPPDDTPWPILDGIIPLGWKVEPWTPEQSFDRFWSRLADVLLRRHGWSEVLA